MSTESDIAASVEKAIFKRRSTRTFEDRPVEEGHLKTILEAGVAAPSGSNSQNQRFLVVTDPDEIEKVGKMRFVWPYKAADQKKMREKNPGGIVGNAAALVVVFADCSITEGRNHGEYYIWESLEIQNCSAAIENMLIMSTALGVGSCWVSASDKMNHRRMFSDSKWQKVFEDYKIKDSFKLQGIVLLGYPKQCDDEGFPTGEKKHGATVWRSVERKPLDSYLVGKGEAEKQADFSKSQKRKLSMYSFGISWCLNMIRKFDKKIWKLELLSKENVTNSYK
jgi:nitroreductase